MDYIKNLYPGRRFNKPEREGLAIEEQKERIEGQAAGRAIVRAKHRGRKVKHLNVPEDSPVDLLMRRLKQAKKYRNM